MSIFTTEVMIQYLYNETSPALTLAISAALESDWSLREKFEELKATSTELTTVLRSPRQQTIDFILNYAEKSVEELTPHA
jgi:hypothetical protein